MCPYNNPDHADRECRPILCVVCACEGLNRDLGCLAPERGITWSHEEWEARRSGKHPQAHIGFCPCLEAPCYWQYQGFEIPVNVVELALNPDNADHFMQRSHLGKDARIVAEDDLHVHILGVAGTHDGYYRHHKNNPDIALVRNADGHLELHRKVHRTEDGQRLLAAFNKQQAAKLADTT